MVLIIDCVKINLKIFIFILSTLIVVKLQILPYTKGDISIIDDPTDSIIRNPNTGN